MHAGRLLAAQIVPRYKDEDVSILALSDGGVVVGMQIAQQLHCPIGFLLIAEIDLPQELITIAGMSQDGSFSYNKMYSAGEIEEVLLEYRGVIEARKMEKLQELHRTLNAGGLVRKDLLLHKTIILVSDGMSSGFSLDLALEFLKPISYKKLVIVTPMASVPVVDRMHLVGDDLYVLNVLEDYISTDHYYDTKDVPPHDVVVKTVAHIMENWRETPKSAEMPSPNEASNSPQA
jgi:putative phosphoribosyl transferase